MANRSCGGRRQQPRTVQIRQTACSEPPVRRWVHPVDCVETVQAEEPALHYIRCALSYQNQLLSEIKTLLEQLTAQEK